MQELVTYGWWIFAIRWLHVLSGVMWIGLLWYFNFVQTPSMPKIPEAQRGAITGFIAPNALFWFRWGAMSTIVTGLIVAYMSGFLGGAIKLGIGDHDPHTTSIGFGMWMGAIMWFNVWFLIWPNQKKILGIVPSEPDERRKAARIAGLASRTNTMLSIPMLYAMVSAGRPFY
jgi:uncharacterized membrane protein